MQWVENRMKENWGKKIYLSENPVEYWGVALQGPRAFKHSKKYRNYWECRGYYANTSFIALTRSHKQRSFSLKFRKDHFRKFFPIWASIGPDNNVHIEENSP